MPVNPEANKVNAQAFYDLTFNKCQPREAIIDSQVLSTSSTIPMWRMVSGLHCVFRTDGPRLPRQSNPFQNAPSQRAVLWLFIATRYGPAVTIMPASISFDSMTMEKSSSIGTCFR